MEEERVVFLNILGKLSHNSPSVRERNMRNLFLKFSTEIFSMEKYSTNRGLLKKMLVWFNYSGRIPCCKEVLILLKQFASYEKGALLLIDLGGVLFLQNLRIEADVWMHEYIDQVVFELLKFREKEDLENDTRITLKKKRESIFHYRSSSRDEEFDTSGISSLIKKAQEGDLKNNGIEMPAYFSTLEMKLCHENPEVIAMGLEEVKRFIMFKDYQKDFVLYVFRSFMKLPTKKYCREMLSILEKVDFVNCYDFPESFVVFISDHVFSTFVGELGRELEDIAVILVVFRNVLRLLKEKEHEKKVVVLRGFEIHLQNLVEEVEALRKREISGKSLYYVETVNFLADLVIFLLDVKTKRSVEQKVQMKASGLVIPHGFHGLLTRLVRKPKFYILFPAMYTKFVGLIRRIGSEVEEFYLKVPDMMESRSALGILLESSGEDKDDDDVKTKLQLLRNSVPALHFVDESELRHCVEVVFQTLLFVKHSSMLQEKQVGDDVNGVVVSLLSNPVEDVKRAVVDVLNENVAGFVANFLQDEIIYVLLASVSCMQESCVSVRESLVRFIVEVFKNLPSKASIKSFAPYAGFIQGAVGVGSIDSSEGYSELTNELVSILHVIVKESEGLRDKSYVYLRFLFHQNSDVRMFARKKLMEVVTGSPSSSSEDDGENTQDDKNDLMDDDLGLMFSSENEFKFFPEETAEAVLPVGALEIRNLVDLLLSTSKRKVQVSAEDLELLKSILLRFFRLFTLKQCREVILDTHVFQYVVTHACAYAVYRDSKVVSQTLIEDERFMRLIVALLRRFLFYASEKLVRFLMAEDEILHCLANTVLFCDDEKRRYVSYLLVSCLFCVRFLPVKEGVFPPQQPENKTVLQIPHFWFENYALPLRWRQFSWEMRLGDKGYDSPSKVVAMGKYLRTLQDEGDVREIMGDQRYNLKERVKVHLKGLQGGDKEGSLENWKTLRNLLVLFPRDVVGMVKENSMFKVMKDQVIIHENNSAVLLSIMDFLTKLFEEFDDEEGVEYLVHHVVMKIGALLLLMAKEGSNGDGLLLEHTLSFFLRFFKFYSKYNGVFIEKLDLIKFLVALKNIKISQRIVKMKILFYLTADISIFLKNTGLVDQLNLRLLQNEILESNVSKNSSDVFGESGSDIAVLTEMYISSCLMYLSNICIIYYQVRRSVIEQLSPLLLKQLILSQDRMKNVIGFQVISKILIFRKDLHVLNEIFPNFFKMITDILFMKNENVILRAKCMSIVNSVILLRTEEFFPKIETIVKRMFLLFNEQHGEFGNLVFLTLYNFLCVYEEKVMGNEEKIDSLITRRCVKFLLKLVSRKKILDLNKEVFIMLSKVATVRPQLLLQEGVVELLEGCVLKNFVNNKYFPKVKVKALNFILLMYRIQKTDEMVFLIQDPRLIMQCITFYNELYKDNQFFTKQKKIKNYCLKIGSVLATVFMFLENKHEFYDLLLPSLIETVSSAAGKIILLEMETFQKTRDGGKKTSSSTSTSSVKELFVYLYNNLGILRNFLLGNVHAKTRCSVEGKVFEEVVLRLWKVYSFFGSEKFEGEKGELRFQMFSLILNLITKAPECKRMFLEVERQNKRSILKEIIAFGKNIDSQKASYVLSLRILSSIVHNSKENFKMLMRFNFIQQFVRNLKLSLRKKDVQRSQSGLKFFLFVSFLREGQLELMKHDDLLNIIFNIIEKKRSSLKKPVILLLRNLSFLRINKLFITIKRRDSVKHILNNFIDPKNDYETKAYLSSIFWTLVYDNKKMKTHYVKMGLLPHLQEILRKYEIGQKYTLDDSVINKEHIESIIKNLRNTVDILKMK